MLKCFARYPRQSTNRSNSLARPTPILSFSRTSTVSRSNAVSFACPPTPLHHAASDRAQAHSPHEPHGALRAHIVSILPLVFFDDRRWAIERACPSFFFRRGQVQVVDVHDARARTKCERMPSPSSAAPMCAPEPAQCLVRDWRLFSRLLACAVAARCPSLFLALFPSRLRKEAGPPTRTVLDLLAQGFQIPILSQAE